MAATLEKDFKTAVPQVESSRRDSIVYARSEYIIGGVWGFVVLLSLLSLDQDALFIVACGAAIVSCGLILIDSRNALIALPYFALLSPVVGFITLQDYKLLLSDFFFVLLGVQVVFIAFRREVRSGSSYSLWITSIGVVFFATCVIGLALGTLVSIKPIIYLAQLVIVYLYTVTLARDEQGWWTIIHAWIIAGLYGSLLLIQAFMIGKPLAAFKYGFDIQLLARENLNYLYQATYYYSGFHYVIGLSIVILFLRLLASNSNLKRLPLAAALTVFVIALIMMANKTAMFSVVISIAAIVCISIYVRKKQVFKIVAFTCASAVLASALLVGGLVYFLGESQAALWLERIPASSPARLEVYTEAITSWLLYPPQILTGMGPDFLDGSGDASLAHGFKYSDVTGITEGTLDSGWLSYLIEMGVVGFCLVIALFIRSVYSVAKHLKEIRRDELYESHALCVLGAQFFLICALFTQMLGYTKVTWFPFQILLIGLMHERFRLKVKSSLRIDEPRFSSLESTARRLKSIARRTGNS